MRGKPIRFKFCSILSSILNLIWKLVLHTAHLLFFFIWIKLGICTLTPTWNWFQLLYWFRGKVVFLCRRQTHSARITNCFSRFWSIYGFYLECFRNSSQEFDLKSGSLFFIKGPLRFFLGRDIYIAWPLEFDRIKHFAAALPLVNPE